MYLITYDISSDRLRNKMARLLLNYGKRVQFSVFECDIDLKNYKKLYGEMVKLTLDKEEVNVRIYILDKNAKEHIQTIGTPFIIPDLTDEIVFV